jgi:DNA-binding response OmpR family regulator
MRLLFVEDNPDLATYTGQSLRDQGFTVDIVDRGEHALAAVGHTRYDALILDLGLPDMSGMQVLKKIREHNADLPVLILTARDGVEDRVAGLNGGADDYLLKPFELIELVARIKALLRRPGGALGLTLHAGNLYFDTVGREVHIGTDAVALSRRELDLLEQLLRRKGRVVPKNVLEETIYGFGEEIASNTIEVALHRLRKNLAKTDAGIQIHTLRGIGYLLQENEV